MADFSIKKFILCVNKKTCFGGLLVIVFCLARLAEGGIEDFLENLYRM